MTRDVSTALDLERPARPANRASSPGLTVVVTSGVGRGPTRIAAFDAALRSAGVHNFNLIKLSSVLPPGSEVVDAGERAVSPAGAWGDRLYVVMAAHDAVEPGEAAWAGIGWVQDERSGKGLLVEHEGPDEARVRRDIEASLASMAAGRPEQFGAVRSVVRGAFYDGEPTCVVVVAAFESDPWRGEVIELE